MINLQKYIISGVIGVVILSVFLLSSGAVNPSWNPFKPLASSDVLESAIAKLSEVKRMKVQGLVELDIKNLPQTVKEQAGNVDSGLSFNKLNGSLSFNQLIDNSNQAQQKKSTDLNLIIGIEGVSMSLELTAIGINKDLFVIVNSLPPVLPASIVPEDIKGKWFKADLANLGLENQNSFGLMQQGNEAAFLADLKKIIEGKQIFKIKKNFGNETIDGVNTSHYSVELDKAAVKELLPKMFDLLSRYIPESNRAQYEQDLQSSLNEFMANFDLIWQKIGGINFDVWVEQTEGRLKKIKFTKTISENSLNLELLFAGFNQNIQIEAPSVYIPIEDIIPKDWLEGPTSTVPVSE
ncbi:MAG: hypothetical protein PHW31_01875 [Candidatus Pacebacteria bacterium]|nr:hypothetical protein [Candidatus Paceibacterota bacterium]